MTELLQLIRDVRFKRLDDLGREALTELIREDAKAGDAPT